MNESRSYVEKIGASDDEEEEDQIINGNRSGLEAERLILKRPTVVSRGRSWYLDAVPRGRDRVDPVRPPCSFIRSTYSPSFGSRDTRQILKIIKLQLHKEGCTWDAVPQEVRDFYWEEFQKHFIWDEAITAMLKVAWEKICTDQYADFTYRMRRSGNKQQCVSQEIWESWCSETGGEMEQDLTRHTGGSISAIETARLLENYTTAQGSVCYFSDRMKSEASQELQRVALYLEALTLLQPEHSDSYCDDDIRAQLADQQRQIAELRAHVIRLSGEHRAGTSPSDPTPATDRHVSTSQQQPLSAPDPDAADDTLV
ncbi:uncharacterized protein LOC110010411 [Jatropha curcas]|uniref:uncharacterized protein LOC110010411 n=1 Tax=Jatropha curcas TaxID=180498 RepID=UPI00189570CE|nr:uncharacterized protein LOC110010411 [Jatropha curcas]